MAQRYKANEVATLVVDNDDESDDCIDSDSDFDGYLDDEEMEELIRRKEWMHGGDVDEDNVIDDETAQVECSESMQVDTEQEMDMNGMDLDYDVMDNENEQYRYGYDNEDEHEQYGHEQEDDGHGIQDDGHGDGHGTMNDNMVVDGNNNETADILLPQLVCEAKCTKDMTNESPLNFLKLLVTDDIIENIVNHTNLNAQQYITTHPNIKRRSRIQSWKKKALTAAEFLKFFALIIVMGINRLPKMEDHWSTKWPFGGQSFSRIMSRDRFSVILRFFHINDSAGYIPKGQPGYDPLYKIRPLLERILQNCRKMYTPNRELALDEAMVSYKGRVWFLQYLPKKPKKWGLKAFALADARTGYVINWSLYAGKYFRK